MKKICVPVGVLSLIVFACSHHDPVDSLENQLTLAELKSSLLTSEQNQLIATKIDTVSSGAEIRISFADNSEVVLNKSFVKGIDVNPGEWTVRIRFRDGSNRLIWMVGDLQVIKKLLVLDPFGQAPLSALVRFTTPLKGRFTVTVHGKGSRGIPITNAFSTISNYHELAVLGLYPAYENEVDFVFYTAQGIEAARTTLTIKTGDIPVKPLINIRQNVLSNQYNGIYFVADLNFGFDQLGEIRWCYTGDQMYNYGKTNNGNLIISSNANRRLFHAESFYEVTMVGQVLRKYMVPNFQHHDIRELPSGNFLVLSNSTPVDLTTSKSSEDLLIEMDRNSGAIVRGWDFNLLLDPTRVALPDISPGDWLHLNSASYNPADNSIIVSGRSQSAVVKLDYPSGKVRWILSNHNHWKPAFTKYLLSPVDSSGQALDITNTDFWPYGQHKPGQLSNGDVLLYDDGDFRGFYDNPTVGSVSYSRAAQYRIDEAAMTVQLVWTFDYFRTVFTPLTGSVDYFPDTGTTLIGYMWSGRVAEIDAQSNVLLDVEINKGANYYRAYKFDLYGGVTDGGAKR